MDVYDVHTIVLDKIGKYTLLLISRTLEKIFYILYSKV